MKNSPFSIHNLNPNLVDSVERAFQRNVEAGRVVSDEFSGDLAKEGLADILKQKAAEDKEKATVYSSALDVIKNPDIREQFANAFRTETALFDRINLKVPDAQMFEEKGVDFAELAEAYDAMDRGNREPVIVIAPYHGSLKVWDNLYTEISKDPTSQLHGHFGNGLYVPTSVSASWSEIDKLPDVKLLPTVTYVSDHLPDTKWIIRIVPGGDQSSHLGTSHSLFEGLHVTVAEYLTIQASRLTVRLKGDGPPIDLRTGTLLNGTLDSRRATFGCWDEYLNHVSINELDTDIGNDQIGIRIPEW